MLERHDIANIVDFGLLINAERNAREDFTAATKRRGDPLAFVLHTF